MRRISLARLKSIVYYNPNNGEFRLKVRLGKMVIGKRLGSAHSHGYIETQILGRRYFLHHLAWFYEYGEWPKRQIDHRNGCRSDNRIANLREATQTQNSANMRRRPNNKSGYKGVVFDERANNYRAYIHVNYKTRYLGTFADAESAHQSYLDAAALAFDSFMRAA